MFKLALCVFMSCVRNAKECSFNVCISIVCTDELCLNTLVWLIVPCFEVAFLHDLILRSGFSTDFIYIILTCVSFFGKFYFSTLVHRCILLRYNRVTEEYGVLCCNTM